LEALTGISRLLRIAFTRIPEPKIEEIDAKRGRRLRPKKEPPTAAAPEE